ncbi:MAG: hypothetical protein PHH54_06500 [Candidatus Nanoarchaeia archaeon]|nr:hypothetical protein [Candidatus Nanoarchaeia archaeon]MDD5741606.1 hypothetical protein [Candidatus Nanoarchaeia archaeon]
MLKNFYSEREPGFYECELCNEPITNPICPVCLSAEMDIWATNYPNIRKELVPRLKRHLKKFKQQTREAVQCIKCNEKRISMCPYCFIREILSELDEIKADKIIKKEFLQFFNYYTEPYVSQI